MPPPVTSPLETYDVKPQPVWALMIERRGGQARVRAEGLPAYWSLFIDAQRMDAVAQERERGLPEVWLDQTQVTVRKSSRVPGWTPSWASGDSATGHAATEPPSQDQQCPGTSPSRRLLRPRLHPARQTQES